MKELHYAIYNQIRSSTILACTLTHYYVFVAVGWPLTPWVDLAVD